MVDVGSIQITPESLALIATIDEFQDVWRALGTFAPEHLKVHCSVATVESLGSSTRIQVCRMTD